MSPMAEPHDLHERRETSKTDEDMERGATKKPYVEPELRRRRRLAEITEGAPPPVTDSPAT